jgi:hypothetical protein
MIKKLETFKELPYNTYTAYLLKTEEDAKKYIDGYLIITHSPKMILLFIDFVEEIG